MISVIIPTLNEEKYLGKLLDSIKKQTYKDYEVIIVDAGSTDKTKEVAAGFNLIQSEANISKQRNLGAYNANGGLLMFLDADIVIRNNDFFEKVSKIFNNKKISAATCKVRVLPKEEKFIDRLFFSLTNNIVRIAGTGRACQIVRAKLFNKFNENMTVGEDVDMFRRIKGKVHFMPSIVYESSRRYRKEGYGKILWHWTASFFSHLLGKPYNYKRKDIR